MPEGDPARPVPRGRAPELRRTPPPFLSPTTDELSVLEARRAELLSALAQCHERFLSYLDGRSTAHEWEEMYKSANRARVAYERKCDAILVRTFRL